MDSGSPPDAAAAYVESAARHGALLVRVDRPGVNLARNHGWRAGTAPLVLFTDDDVEVERDWADAYAAAFASHPEASFVTGWIGALEDDKHDVAVVADEQPRVLDRSSRGTLGHGASLAVRREALEAIGGWDEAMGAGSRFRAAPEVDLFDRLLHSGRTGWFEPTARARHEQWRGTAEVTRLHVRYSLGQGARLAKLIRYDRGLFLHAARESFWGWGLYDLLDQLRRGNFARAGTAVLRLGGFVAGFFDAITTRVVDGHYRLREQEERARR